MKRGCLWVACLAVGLGAVAVSCGVVRVKGPTFAEWVEASRGEDAYAREHAACLEQHYAAYEAAGWDAYEAEGDAAWACGVER